MLFGLFAVLIGLAYIGMLVAAIWVLVIAGKEGAMHVVLCLFLPFYSLYYVFTRLDRTGVPAAIYGVSLILMIVFSAAMGAVAGGGAAEPADGNYFDAPIAQNTQFDPGAGVVPAKPAAAAPGPMPADPMAEMSAGIMPPGDPALPGDPAEANGAAAALPGPPGPMPAGDGTLPGGSGMPPGDPGMPPGDSGMPPAAVGMPPGPPGEPGMPAEAAATADGLGTPFTPAVVEPEYAEGWKGEAQRAFYHGRNDEGRRFLHASLVATDDADTWEPVRYSAALDRPVAGLRFGIGLQKVEKVPAHIMAMMKRGGQPGGNGGGAGLEQPMGLEGPMPGDMGLAEPMPGGAPAVGGGIKLQGGGAPELREYTGDIGDRVIATFPESGLEKLLGELPAGQTWGKRAEFVGVGENLEEVVSMARQRGLDVLGVAVVTIALRGRIVDATLSVRLIDVATEKRLWTSPTLNSNRVKVAMSQGKDPAGDMIAGVTEYLEKHFQLAEKPALDKAKVQERLDELVSDDVENPLPLLFELRYFQRQGAVTAAQAEAYYKELVGLDEAAALATGTDDQRRQIVERYVPKSSDE